MAENSKSSGNERGFAAMDKERQKEIASEGGKAAHEKGTAHEFTTDEARQAGRKGGESVSQDRAHMSEIGRKGGQSSGNQRQEKSAGNQSKRDNKIKPASENPDPAKKEHKAS